MTGAGFYIFNNVSETGRAVYSSFTEEGYFVVSQINPGTAVSFNMTADMVVGGSLICKNITVEATVNMVISSSADIVRSKINPLTCDTFFDTKNLYTLFGNNMLELSVADVAFIMTDTTNKFVMREL